MKKTILMMICSFVISISVANAHYLFDKYNNDPDYVYVCEGKMGKMYLEWKNIKVDEYTPPHYQITGRFVMVIGQTPKDLHEVEEYITIRYNWYTKESFRQNKYGNWEKDSKELYKREYENHTPDNTNIRSANVLFRVAYGMDFYN